MVNKSPQLAKKNHSPANHKYAGIAQYVVFMYDSL